MTSSEELELARARAKAKLRLRQSQAVREEQEAESDMSTVDKARGAIQSFNKGTTLGFGDEIVAGGRALLDYGMDALTDNPLEDVGESQSLGDRYRMYRGDERDVTKDFEEDYGKTALALNVLGGVASPANLVGGSVVGGSRAAASAVAKRALLEGGAAGFGESEADITTLDGDDIYDAGIDTLQGAATGLGVSTGLRALGKTGAKLAKRRVAEDLVDETGRRKPLSMADEPIADVYRSISRLPGARGKIEALEAPYVEEAAEKISREAENLRLQKSVAREAQEEASIALKRRGQEITDTIEKQAERATQRAKDLPGDIAEREASQFRATAAMEALPTQARGVLEDIDVANDVPAVRERLSSWWINDGFREVKDRAFDWSGDVDKGLKKQLREAFANDPKLAIEAGGAIEDIGSLVGKLKRAGGTGNDLVPEDFVEDMLSSNEIVGIDGDALMAMRNVFAKKGTWASRQIANKFDDMIRKQLKEADPKLAEHFDEQIERYTTALSYMAATRSKAARATGGLFTPSQYMTSAGRYGGKGMSNKAPPLESSARGAQSTIDSAETAGKKASGEAADQKRLAAKSARRRLDKERQALKKAQRAENFDLAELEKTGPLPQARAAAKELNSKLSPKGQSFISDYLVAREAGQVIPGPVKAKPYKAAQGIGLGKMIGSDFMQDSLAGQAGWQKALSKAMRDGDMDMVTRLLSRQAAISGGGE